MNLWCQSQVLLFTSFATLHCGVMMSQCASGTHWMNCNSLQLVIEPLFIYFFCSIDTELAAQHCCGFGTWFPETCHVIPFRLSWSALLLTACHVIVITIRETPHNSWQLIAPVCKAQQDQAVLLVPKAVSLNPVAAEWKSGVVLGQWETFHLGSLIHFGPDMSVNGSSDVSHSPPFCHLFVLKLPISDTFLKFGAFVFIWSWRWGVSAGEQCVGKGPGLKLNPVRAVVAHGAHSTSWAAVEPHKLLMFCRLEMPVVLCVYYILPLQYLGIGRAVSVAHESFMYRRAHISSTMILRRCSSRPKCCTQTAGNLKSWDAVCL